MVTRTVEITVATAMCVDVNAQTVSTVALELTGKVTNDTALKQLKKVYENDTFKVVSVTALTTREEMYGMTELEFIKIAKKLDPTTRAILSESEDDCIDDSIN